MACYDAGVHVDLVGRFGWLQVLAVWDRVIFWDGVTMVLCVDQWACFWVATFVEFGDGLLSLWHHYGKIFKEKSMKSFYG